MEFRPADIGLLFGQEHLTDTLTAWVGDPKLIPHSLLIYGPYGSGKTSTARILAKKLTTVERDIREINAAEARGIDDVREWAEATRYRPIGEARVYIIDELHQMTPQAQSALLKVIEEPGSHTYFILCTTEPHRLLPAIRSRCVQIEIKLLNFEAATELMNYLSKGKITADVASQIYRRTGGHARDIVKMAQTLALSQYRLSQENILVGVGTEEFKSLLSKPTLNKEELQRVLSVNDQQMIGYIVDEVIDSQVAKGDIVYTKRFDRLLNMRVLRREYKVSAKEQLLHFLSETKDIPS
jgi:DNA polymerase III gamma/tau subunit